MTREEAIEYAESKKMRLEALVYSDDCKYGNYAMYSGELSFVNAALTALRPVSRERMKKMRGELDSVKCERDAAIKDLFEIIGDIEEIRCGYDVDNADADEAFAELCNGYCANAGNFCYKEGEHYRCKHFKWRGPRKED